jgi:hypothetical protein
MRLPSQRLEALGPHQETARAARGSRPSHQGDRAEFEPRPPAARSLVRPAALPSRPYAATLGPFPGLPGGPLELTRRPRELEALASLLARARAPGRTARPLAARARGPAGPREAIGPQAQGPQRIARHPPRDPHPVKVLPDRGGG